MSKLNISENLFLEVNELKQLVQFIEEDGWKRAVKYLVTKFGIVRDENNTQFKVTVNANGTAVDINPGLAFTSSMDAIVSRKIQTISTNNIIDKMWLIISRSTTNYEEGTINIDAVGNISGNSTEFLKVLRGQPNFPVKVAFDSVLNSGEYEVVNVVNDTSAVVVGDFTPENNIRYKVIGTFTPGFNPSPANKYIYEYDDCNITVIDSPSMPTLNPDEYLIACVYDNNGTIEIEDYRIYYMMNYDYEYVEESDGQNPLVALLECSNIGKDNLSIHPELIAEHGYKINAYTFVYSNQTIFTITNGGCAVYGNLSVQNNIVQGSIPDDAFNGWILLNRTNMRYCKIDKNVNNVLHVSTFDIEMIDNSANDFVIIPNFDAIEYQITVSNNVRGNDKKFFFRQSIENIHSRLPIYLLFPSVNASFANVVSVDIRYRMIDSKKKYGFKEFAATTFTNITNEPEVLGNSDFEINVADFE